MKRYAVIFEKSANGWGAYVPDLPGCVAVTAVGEVFNYLFDSNNDEQRLHSLFRRIYDALVPAGLFLFDIATPERMKPGPPQRTFAYGPDWAVLVEFSVEAGVLTRHNTSFRKTGDLYRRDTEVHRLALMEPTSVLESLRGAGFEAQIIPSYRAVPVPHGLVAFLARK